MKETLAKIKQNLVNLTSSDELNSTGIAIGVKSVHEDSPLFEFYHTPAIAEATGTKEVTIDTVFRGGSITKLFTVLTALQDSHIKGSDPVTKYLPQLKEGTVKAPENSSFNVIPWDTITVEDLASHLSGIGGDSEYLSLSTVSPSYTDSSSRYGSCQLCSLPLEADGPPSDCK